MKLSIIYTSPYRKITFITNVTMPPNKSENGKTNNFKRGFMKLERKPRTVPSIAYVIIPPEISSEIKDI